MHARKTRQRKKEHSQILQGRADELKQEQLRLRQVINEKHTAKILVGLFATNSVPNNTMDDPKIEELLRRPVDEIPDASKIPELPALILPGHHNSKRGRASTSSAEWIEVIQEQKHAAQTPDNLHGLPDDGIDYELLGKDRSKCTPQELDKIRRERNRMHAKRTRDRKRKFMEEMEELIKSLEIENEMLVNYLGKMDVHETAPVTTATEPSPAVVSPSLPSTATDSSLASSSSSILIMTAPCQPENFKVAGNLKSLLVAAGAFEFRRDGGSTMDLLSSAATVVSTSADVSGSSCCSDQESQDSRPKKRRRLDQLNKFFPSAVPSSITTSTAIAMGCQPFLLTTQIDAGENP